MQKKKFDGTFTDPQKEVLWLFIEARRILSDAVRAGRSSSEQVAAEAAAFKAAAKAGYDFNEDGGFLLLTVAWTRHQKLEEATIRFTDFCEKVESY